mgnify:CR=1 FL=1
MEGKARIKRNKHAGNIRQSAQLNRAEAIRRDFIRFIFPYLTFLAVRKKFATQKTRRISIMRRAFGCDTISK